MQLVLSGVKLGIDLNFLTVLHLLLELFNSDYISLDLMLNDPHRSVSDLVLYLFIVMMITLTVSRNS